MNFCLVDSRPLEVDWTVFLTTHAQGDSDRKRFPSACNSVEHSCEEFYLAVGIFELMFAWDRRGMCHSECNLIPTSLRNLYPTFCPFALPLLLSFWAQRHTRHGFQRRASRGSWCCSRASVRANQDRTWLVKAQKEQIYTRPITRCVVTGGKGGMEEGDNHMGCALSQDTLPQIDREGTNHSQCTLNPNLFEKFASQILYPKYCQFALPPSLSAPALWCRKQ